MNLLKNMLAAVGVMALLVLVINTATAEAGKIIKAFEREEAAQEAFIRDHKAFISGDKNQLSDEGY